MSARACPNVAALLILSALTALGPLGCNNVEKAAPRPTPSRASGGFELDVPQVMRGTIASETIVLGYQPVVVRGYGLVVGLQGTGSRQFQPDVRAHMLQEMRRNGIGRQQAGFGDLKPEQMLDSLDTAIVIVEGVISPGATIGESFDVRIYADPRTETTSLEGGTLYTAELRAGGLRTGRGQAFPVALARGPIFINPFAEPGAIERQTVSRTAGRILDGGRVSQDLIMRLRLATPSHARVAIIQDSINAQFPQEPGQHDPTARGESDEFIAITVPPSWRGRSTEFVQHLRHSTIVLGRTESVATGLRRLLEQDPTLAPAVSLRWQALGKRVLPVIKPLYDDAEEVPRTAALRAGAGLDDPLVVPHLVEMTKSTNREARLESVRLMAKLRANAYVNQSLHELLDHEDTETRLSAYEALIERNDPMIERYVVDNKFLVDVVESKFPTIYVTQIGRPRIVLFDRDLHLDIPLTVNAWSNRFMVMADAEDREVEVYYRDEEAMRGYITRVEPWLPKFIAFLGHTTTVDNPEPGLGLSYGETVGALHQIWSQRHIDADFKAEQDRILAAILETEAEEEVENRPEFEGVDEPVTNEGNADAAFGPVIPSSDLDQLQPALPGSGTTGSAAPGR